MPRIRAKVDAIVSRLIPSTRLWRNVGEDVTFTVRGFVAAEDPPTLLARHNYETAEIRRCLTGTYRRSLEIGCGFGRLSPHLAASSLNHTGVDINPNALSVARRHYPKYDYREASAMSLPFPDGTFDLVTTWTVLQHVRPHRIDQVMDEIRRVATDAATILLCEESALSDKPQPDRWHTHTWHRRPDFYVDRLPGFDLVEARDVGGLARVGIPTPGTVVLLRGTASPPTSG